MMHSPRSTLPAKLAKLNLQSQHPQHCPARFQAPLLCPRVLKAESQRKPLVKSEVKNQVKSRITLRDTWSKRQAGAMRPVRRAVCGCGCGLQAVLQQQKAARAKCVCAGAARGAWEHLSYSLFWGFPCSCLPRSVMNHGPRFVEVQYRVSVRGALYLSSLLFKPLQRRNAAYITNRDINPGYVGAMHCCGVGAWV